MNGHEGAKASCPIRGVHDSFVTGEFVMFKDRHDCRPISSRFGQKDKATWRCFNIRRIQSVVSRLRGVPCSSHCLVRWYWRARFAPLGCYKRRLLVLRGLASRQSFSALSPTFSTRSESGRSRPPWRGSSSGISFRIGSFPADHVSRDVALARQHRRALYRAGHAQGRFHRPSNARGRARSLFRWRMNSSRRPSERSAGRWRTLPALQWQ